MTSPIGDMPSQIIVGVMLLMFVGGFLHGLISQKSVLLGVVSGCLAVTLFMVTIVLIYGVAYVLGTSV